jgi:predicted O-linked N-acetylglucosamine transferase (SPINDLY family)
VGGEFREHAMALLMAGLYEHHNKRKFEIIAFDVGWNDASPLRKRLEAAFDKWIDLAGLSDRQRAERIAEENVDILVNIIGYFQSEPMGIFAYRPAPVQVSYLGYPATLGAPYIDYLLADRIVVPEEEQRFYSEKIVYLPDTYWVNDRRRLIGESVHSRSACGLPEQGFVFCNFNHIYKLTPKTFALWMDILREVKGSVLWLLESNQEFPSRLRAEAERQGIAGERLVFAPPAAPADHLARIKLADLCLDSLPYNAHTTACDCLWVGVPVLTCLGGTFPGRVAASLLKAMGLPELVANNPEDYRKMALGLAGDSAYLERTRQKLMANRLTTPLFDTARFTRHIEAAYQMMWEISQRGENPQGFSVAPLD